MGNFLEDATPSADSVISGGQVNVTLLYESDDGGMVDVMHTSGYDVTHGPLSLQAGTTQVTVPLTIRRTSSTLQSCDLRFEFYTSEVFTSVEVK
jgi:hypothetical protein